MLYLNDYSGSLHFIIVTAVPVLLYCLVTRFGLQDVFHEFGVLQNIRFAFVLKCRVFIALSCSVNSINT